MRTKTRRIIILSLAVAALLVLGLGVWLICRPEPESPVPESEAEQSRAETEAVSSRSQSEAEQSRAGTEAEPSRPQSEAEQSRTGTEAEPSRSQSEAESTAGGPCTAHRDSNDDGICDLCRADLLVEIDFFAVNDLHGKYADTDSQPGVDELTTYLLTEGTNTILLSSGDMWQGAYESNLTDGRLSVAWMNRTGFVSMTLGNHEFDWGPALVEANAALADFPFLAINIYDRATKTRLPYCEPSVTVERDGVTVGIIGAMGDCYSSISSERTTDIYFVTGAELTKLIKAESERLRAAGADFIVLSIHDGYGSGTGGQVLEVPAARISDYYDAALSEGWVDLVFEGHTHQSYVLKDDRGVYHLQGGGENRGISHAELLYNTVTDSHRISAAEVVPSGVYAQAGSSPIRDELLEEFAEEISQGTEEKGINPVYRDSDYMKALVAEQYYKLGMETWGDKYDIVLGGGYISIRSPYGLNAGKVTYGDLLTLFPFNNQLVLCAISGKYLRSQFFETSNKNYFICTGEYGESVRKNIDDKATYYIVIDTYSSQYAPNHCTEVERYTDGVYARDLLAEYFEAGKEEEGYSLTSVAEILRLGQTLAPGAFSDESYYVKGTVLSVSNYEYGNLTVQDENGDSLFIYGVNSKTDNVRYDRLEHPPVPGDSIVVCGQIQRYVSSAGTEQIELYRTLLIECETPGEQVPEASEGPSEASERQYPVISVEEALRLAAALEKGAVSRESYYVKGVIESIANAEYGDLTIGDGAGHSIYVYGISAGNGARFGSIDPMPKEGEEILLYGPLQRYMSPDGEIPELFRVTLIR